MKSDNSPRFVTGVWCFLLKMKSNRSEKRSTKPHKPMESQNAHSPAHPSQGFRSHPTPNAHFHACTAMARVQVRGKVQNRFHTVREMLQPSLELCSACLSETSFPGSSNSFYLYYIICMDIRLRRSQINQLNIQLNTELQLTSQSHGPVHLCGPNLRIWEVTFVGG